MSALGTEATHRTLLSIVKFISGWAELLSELFVDSSLPCSWTSCWLVWLATDRELDALLSRTFSVLLCSIPPFPISLCSAPTFPVLIDSVLPHAVLLGSVLLFSALLLAAVLDFLEPWRVEPAEDVPSNEGCRN